MNILLLFFLLVLIVGGLKRAGNVMHIVEVWRLEWCFTNYVKNALIHVYSRCLDVEGVQVLNMDPGYDFF